MAGGMDLLRLLEPAVRPGGLPGISSTPKLPIESQDFDAILLEARNVSESGATAQAAEAKEIKHNDLLSALGRVDQIDNAALLKFIGSSRA